MPVSDDWRVCIAFSDPSNRGPTAMWSRWPGILPPRVGGSARAAGTSSSGRTAKTTLRAAQRSPERVALMRIRPSASGGLATATFALARCRYRPAHKVLPGSAGHACARCGEDASGCGQVGRVSAASPGWSGLRSAPGEVHDLHRSGARRRLGAAYVRAPAHPATPD
jgi:hypothetical protein